MRADGQDPTAAARQARRRARRQAQDAQAQVTLGHVLAAVLELSTKVDNLAQTVGKRDVTPRRRDVTPEGARARAGGTRPQAPTGPVGPLAVTPSRPPGELAADVLAALQGHGANSTGAIRDALGHQGLEVPVTEVATALVQLLGAGHVIREPGATTAQPDTWRAIPGALRSLELEAVPVLDVKPTPDLHVTCQDYRAHHRDHAWDDTFQAFVCRRCHDPAPSAGPPQAVAGGAAN